MAGNYLKSLQLAKQLEERAREATRNKEKAEKQYQELEDFLKICRENDVDISESQKLLSEYNAQMASKDYQTALATLARASEATKSAFVQKIGEVADSVDALLSTAPGIESKSASDMLEKSRQLVVKDDFEGAMKLAKSAYDAAERTLHEYFSELFSQAQEMIMQAKEIGDDVSVFEDQISKAKSDLEKQEYESAITEVKEALEGAGENMKRQINTSISNAEELVTAGEELGADMSRIRAHIEKANKSLDALRFKESLSYAKRAESDGENTITNKFQESVREVREGIKKLKNMNLDASVSQQLLDQAQSAMKDKKFIEALHALSLAKERTREAQFQSVLEVIAKARDKFVLAKKVGVDMSKAIALLNTSRDNLKLGKFEDAMRYAEDSQKEVDNSLSVFYSARDGLVELSKVIKAASDLEVDVTPLKRGMAEAKRLFESKEYAKAVECTKETMTLARKLSYDRTMEMIDRADKAVKLGKELGSDVTEAEGVLHRALEMMSKEDMFESVNLSKASLEASSAAMTRTLSDRLQSLDSFVKGYTGDADLTEVNELLARARQNVGDADFAEANELLKEIAQKIEKSGQELSGKLIAQATEKIEALRSMQGDVSDLEILLSRAKDSYEQKVYEEATAKAKEVISQADELTVRLTQAQFSSIKDLLEEAKAIGIDIEDARINLKEAREKTDGKEYAEALRIINSIRNSLVKQISHYDGVKDKIRRAEELIADAERSKADIAPLERKLDSAKNAFGSGDLDTADRLLDALVQETERNLAMYLAAKFILTSKENIDLAQANSIDVQEGQDLLSQAKDLMKKKDYESALNMAKMADENLRKTIKNALDGMIKDLQRLLTDAKNVGVDTVGPEKLAEKALEMASEGNFPEAFNCISSAKDDIDHVKNLSSQAAIEIRVARNNLKDAETLDMDVGRAREFLEQAVDALTRHQYAIALELAKKSSETSLEVTRSRIWTTLEKFKERIEKAASEGAPIGLAERCVAEGVLAFREGRYQDALRHAMKCEVEMDRAELQRDITARAVGTARKKLNDALAEGIKSQRLVSLVEKAERLMGEGKFVEALSAAIESGDELHSIRENLDATRIEFAAVRDQIERLRKVNIDTSDCDEVLEMAQDFLGSYDFARCRDALRRCSEKAAQRFESSIKDIMTQNKEIITRAKEMGINTRACEDMLAVANTSFSEKLWDFAYQQAMACKSACLELIEKKMTSLIDDTRDKMSRLNAIGASTRPIEEMIEDARHATEAGDPATAFRILMDTDRRIAAIEESHKRFMDISIAAESAIDILHRFGMPTRESERLLALADVEKDKDYDSAIEFVAEALDTAKSLMESYSPDISASVSTLGLQEDAPGFVVVTLKNDGKALAKNISVEISGDLEVGQAQELQVLKPGDSAEVKIGVVPKSNGSIPIRVSVSARRHFDGKLQTFDFEETLTVFKPGPPFKLGRATDVAKCASCQGRIKPGFDILTCRCGNQLHLACAKRVGYCPVCNQKYSF